MTRLHRALAMTVLLCFAGGAARAQSVAPAPGSTATVPEKTAPGTPPATNLDAKSGTLSEKLSDTNGVIRPTDDVDPAMHKTAPQTGTMPVVRPGDVAPGTAK